MVDTSYMGVCVCGGGGYNLIIIWLSEGGFIGTIPRFQLLYTIWLGYFSPYLYYQLLLS